MKRKISQNHMGMTRTRDYSSVRDLATNNQGRQQLQLPKHMDRPRRSRSVENQNVHAACRRRRRRRPYRSQKLGCDDAPRKETPRAHWQGRKELVVRKGWPPPPSTGAAAAPNHRSTEGADSPCRPELSCECECECESVAGSARPPAEREAHVRGTWDRKDPRHRTH
jgi:hypothetical protein